MSKKYPGNEDYSAAFGQFTEEIRHRKNLGKMKSTTPNEKERQAMKNVKNTPGKAS